MFDFRAERKVGRGRHHVRAGAPLARATVILYLLVEDPLESSDSDSKSEQFTPVWLTKGLALFENRFLPWMERAVRH